MFRAGRRRRQRRNIMPIKY